MVKERKGKLSPLSAELKAVLRDIGQQDRAIHPEIWARWSDMVGSELSCRAVPRSFSRGTLVIAVASSAWLQELCFLKHNILERIAQEIGAAVVKDIYFVVDSSVARLAKKKCASRDKQNDS